MTLQSMRSIRWKTVSQGIRSSVIVLSPVGQPARELAQLTFIV